jgi:pilus assembly protein CpaE
MMHCTRIHLIGCDDCSVPAEARGVLRRWGTLDESFTDAAKAIRSVWMTETETRLFVLRVASDDDLMGLKHVAAKFPGRPILAVVDASDDSSMLLKAMRAGAAQVVTAPVAAADLQEALDCISKQLGSVVTPAKTIAVAGASGGSGATAIAINVAYEIAELKKTQVILLELAMRMGVIANYLDIRPRYTTADLVGEIGRVDSFVLKGALTERSPNFSILAGPYESIQTTAPDVDSVLQLIELTKPLANVIVLDVPSTFDDLYFKTLATADQVVLVAEQTVCSIRGAQMVCDVLEHRRPLVVVNRFDRKTSGLSEDRLRQFMKPCEVQTVAFDGELARSLNEGKPLRECSPRSAALADIDALVEKLAPQTPDKSSDEKPTSILGRLTRALSLS